MSYIECGISDHRVYPYRSRLEHGRFNAENVKEEGSPKWYRTFHADEQGTWIGIRLKKGVYLLTFGDSGEY